MADAATVELLRPGDHVCWTFDDDQRRSAVVAGLVRDALLAGQKIVYYTDGPDPERLIAALDGCGVPAAAAAGTGQLRVRPATGTYRTSGRSWAASMAATWADEVDLGRAQGWPGVRMLGDMTWAARRAVGADRLAWYEAQINRVFADGYATAVCFYDRRLFAPAELNRITAAHPATTGDGAGAADDWQPLLRFRRTTDPAGLRLSGQADASNRDALTAVLNGLFEDVAVPAGAAIRPDVDTISRSGTATGCPVGDGARPATGRPGRTPVTVDVSELTFADGAAAHLLVRTAHAAPTGLRLAGCSPGLARLLDLVTNHVLPAGLVVEPA